MSIVLGRKSFAINIPHWTSSPPGHSGSQSLRQELTTRRNIMKWTDIPHGDVIAAQQRFWVAFGDNAGAIATRINTDPTFLKRMVEFSMGSKPSELHLRFRMPPEIAMVAAIINSNRALNDQSVEFAIYRKDFDAGQLTSVSEGDFGELKVRYFSPCPGCGLSLKDGRINAIGPGLRNFNGKRAKIIVNLNTAALIVWKNEEAPFPPGFMEELTGMMHGLSFVLQ